MKVQLTSKAASFIQTHSLAILLVLFYLSEGYSKLSMYALNERPILTKAIKLLVLIIFSLFLFKSKKIIIQILFISACFVIGQFFISPNFDQTILITFIKYLFPIILFTYYHKKQLDDIAFFYLGKTFELVIVSNSILIILGVVFNIELFETYEGSRFGYNGLLVTSATSTYVYFIALFYFLLKYKNEFIYRLKALFILITCVIVATKSLFIWVIVVLLYYFVAFANKKLKYLGITSIALLGVSGTYYALFISGLFNEIRINEGLITAILSHRDVILLEKTIPFINDNWTLVNYLFGGINDMSSRPQMGFIDLLYFFGIFGSLFYLYTYITSYFKFKLNRMNLLFFLSLGLIVAISGNFFLNASVVIYMLVIRAFLFKNDDEINTSS